MTVKYLFVFCVFCCVNQHFFRIFALRELAEWFKALD